MTEFLSRNSIFDEDALARTLADSHGLDADHGGWAGDDTALLALRVPEISTKV